VIFYKETEFQDAPIGRMPKDWNFDKLENICEKVKAGGTPLTSVKDYWNGNIPFVKIEDLTTSGKYLVRTQSFISKDGLAKSSAWIVPENSLLLAMYGSMGEASINKIPVATNQAIIGIIPKNQEDVHFLYYWYLFFKPNWKRYAKPTTQANLTAKIIRSSLIPLPSEKERKAIAKVLGVVDSAVELVDKVIWKTERLKKGLMQTLLTRGIGHKEYKQTPIGTIPKTWKVARLEEIAEINREKRDPAKTMPHETFVYIDIDSVENETGKIRNPKKILGKDAPSRARRVVHENDVIMSTVRPYLKAFAIIPKEYDNQICSTGFAVLSCKDSIIPYFLLSVLLSDGVIKQCNKMMVGGQYPALNQSQVSRIKIPLPPLDEQKTITSIFWATDKKLEIERSEKAKLERVKQGLMDLLLTGKIRVKVS
jgi:type I restriction enzyme S subunit